MITQVKIIHTRWTELPGFALLHTILHSKWPPLKEGKENSETEAEVDDEGQVEEF